MIIEVDSDHFVNFFYNNLPSFCVGMGGRGGKSQETWCPMPRYTVPVTCRRPKRVGNLIRKSGQTMSVYRINKLLYHTDNDPIFASGSP